MKLQVITNNVGGLYTEEKLKEESYAGPTEAGASNWVCVWVGICMCLFFVVLFVIYRVTLYIRCLYVRCYLP